LRIIHILSEILTNKVLVEEVIQVILEFQVKAPRKLHTCKPGRDPGIHTLTAPFLEFGFITINELFLFVMEHPLVFKSPVSKEIILQQTQLDCNGKSQGVTAMFYLCVFIIIGVELIHIVAHILVQILHDQSNISNGETSIEANIV